MPVPSFEIIFYIEQQMENYQKKYRSVKELLHESDITQFYDLGYDKAIVNDIFKIVKTSKIDKQVTSAIAKIGYECNLSLKNKIVNATRFLDEAIENGVCNQHVVLMTERLYCILNGIHEIPKCKVCDKELKNFAIGRTSECHYDCCSAKCKANDPDSISKRVKTYLSRSPEAKLKTKMQTQATIEQRFGNKCFMKTNYFKQKTLEYIKENGGECNVSQIKEIREKVDKTNEKIYGNKCNLANKDQLELKRQTYTRHYGVDHPMKNENFKKQFFDQLEASFGYRFLYQSPQCIDKVRKNRDNRHRMIISKNEFVAPLFDLQSEQNLLCDSKQYWWQCLECGHCFAAPIIGYSRNDGRIVNCPFCNLSNHKTSHSYQELELVDFLRKTFPSLKIFNSNNKINRHIIPPYEIDVWIPEKNIGIEYNGSFWHSIEFLQKYKETDMIDNDNMFMCLKKKILCEQKNIHLIHIYEDEWILQKDAIKKLLIDLILQNTFICQDQLSEIIIPYDKYPSFMQIKGYYLSHITQPMLQEHDNMKNKKYHIYDSGNLVFKQIECK